MENKNNEIMWEPHGKVCLKCGAQNPDGHEICGGCGERATEFEEGELPKEKHEERNAIKRALK